MKHNEAAYGSAPMSELVCDMAGSVAEGFGKLFNADRELMTRLVKDSGITRD